MIKAFLFDLDGVFYVDNNIIPGALSTLKWLNEKNIQYKFITNNTTSSRLKLLNKLKNLGLSTEKENIISANFAGVLFLEKIGVKSCELILPESGIEDYKKFKIVKKNPEVIVVGDIGNNWTFELMNDLFRGSVAQHCHNAHARNKTLSKLRCTQKVNLIVLKKVNVRGLYDIIM